MQLNAIQVKNYVEPYMKPIYERCESKLIANKLACYFQQELGDRMRRKIRRFSSNRFPMTDRISFYIDIHSRRSLSIPGIAKNILDAYSKILYSDDSIVESMILHKHEWEHDDTDRLDIRVIQSYKLGSIEVTEKQIEPYLILSDSFETVLVDKYLPYPPSMDYTDAINPNAQANIQLKKVIRDQYEEQLSDSNVSVSLIMENVSTRKSDLDNLSMTYLVNMQGVVYESIENIDKLHMSIDKGSNKEENAIILIFRK
jgi:hypothetical protein